MKLKCMIDDEPFNMLGDQKEYDFRQFEEIVFENNVTGDIKTFLVDDVVLLPDHKASQVKERYPKIPWDPRRPIFAIALGSEIKHFVNKDLTAAPQDLDKVRASNVENTKHECWV